jgi:hypothetical protein
MAHCDLRNFVISRLGGWLRIWLHVISRKRVAGADGECDMANRVRRKRKVSMQIAKCKMQIGIGVKAWCSSRCWVNDCDARAQDDLGRALSPGLFRERIARENDTLPSTRSGRAFDTLRTSLRHAQDEPSTRSGRAFDALRRNGRPAQGKPS